jgi:chromate transporter
MFEVFKAFLFLGMISFGGPAAHIGYFRNTFVVKKQWLNESQYADIVALSQFLPGPGSSQVGFSIGYHKAGIKGAIAAFVGFTFPSMLLMIAMATLSTTLLNTPLFQSMVHGLKLLAVVVVADAIWGMFSQFCRTKAAILICAIAASGSLIISSVLSQFALLLCAAIFGAVKFQSSPTDTDEQRFSPAWMNLILFVIVVVLGAILAPLIPEARLFSDFFNAGSLVFGGGHVVLPLLQQAVGDTLSNDQFLTGYAAAQAIPGPMFTFATYLGYLLFPSSPLLGAFIATLAIFTPGFLLILVVLKDWAHLSRSPRLSGLLKGVNAAVVGFLIAALYNPIFVSAVNTNIDFVLVLMGFTVLRLSKPPIVLLVAMAILCGMLLPYLPA